MLDSYKRQFRESKEIGRELSNPGIHRGQAVVNSVQLKELGDLIKFLGEDVFTDPQKPYYLTIDGLDENWVDDSLRYKLIRALIESVRNFQKVENVKIIIALRHDLLLKVFSATIDLGFQEEKYHALIMRLRWNGNQSETLIDRRIALLVRQQYTSRPVRMRELFPDKIGRTPFNDYLMQRTALRPRDAILFVNECILRAEAAGQVKVANVFAAETEYSRLRKVSLIHEWKRVYPSLERSTSILERTGSEFKLASLNKNIVDALIEDLVSNHSQLNDSCSSAASLYLNSPSASRHAVIAKLFKVFFEVGLVGLRFEGGSGWMWSQKETPMITSGQIKPNTKAQIHPMFYQALYTYFQT